MVVDNLPNGAGNAGRSTGTTLDSSTIAGVTVTSLMVPTLIVGITFIAVALICLRRRRKAERSEPEALAARPVGEQPQLVTTTTFVHPEETPGSPPVYTRSSESLQGSSPVPVLEPVPMDSASSVTLIGGDASLVGNQPRHQIDTNARVTRRGELYQELTWTHQPCTPQGVHAKNKVDLTEYGEPP